ncbi:MAG: potassium transporter membrane component TrkH, partial [Nitrospinae bacterium CG22_combo_CG10-13_8_21_14_all_47_10]
MNIRSIFSVVGVLLVLLSGLTLPPMGVALYYDHDSLEGFISEIRAFGWTFGISLVTGLILWKLFPSGLEKLRD